MAKNKPKETIEYVIRLQDKERQLLEDLATSYRIQAIDPEAMFKILEDPSRIIQIAYGIATALEILGFETGLPTPVDLLNYLRERDVMGEKAAATGRPSIFSMVLDFLKGSGDFEGTWPGGY